MIISPQSHQLSTFALKSLRLAHRTEPAEAPTSVEAELKLKVGTYINLDSINSENKNPPMNFGGTIHGK